MPFWKTVARCLKYLIESIEKYNLIYYIQTLHIISSCKFLFHAPPLKNKQTNKQKHKLRYWHQQLLIFLYKRKSKYDTNNLKHFYALEIVVKKEEISGVETSFDFYYRLQIGWIYNKRMY